MLPVDNVCRFSPVFRDQEWKPMHIKDTTRGAMIWEIKTARVRLVDSSTTPSRPTNRPYWLIVARNPKTREYKYFVSNRYGFLRRVADAKSLLDEAASPQDWLRGSYEAGDGVVFEAGWEPVAVFVNSWRREVGRRVHEV
jgi:hypothetical protein